MRFRYFLVSIILCLSFCLDALAIIRFAHLSDPHIFEGIKHEKDAEVSSHYFKTALQKINDMAKSPKQKSDTPISFILMSGDIGVGKLLYVDPKTGKLTKDAQKWSQAINSFSQILKNSDVKTWLFVPGNNDLFEEQATSIGFYSTFLKELQEAPEIKRAGLTIVDLRQESSQKIQPQSPPGMYVVQNFVFVGWDNSFFKNNNSVRNYIDPNHHLIPVEQTIDYKSLVTLQNNLKGIRAKYAFLFFHIPEIDDPYLILFDVSKKGNIVSNRMAEAKALSASFAAGLYPYSAWTVPLGVRQLWEEIVLKKDRDGPTVKGLFAGHFHDHKRETYLTTSWVKSKKYKDEILKMLYIAPPVSVKNQTQYAPANRAIGGQMITIDDNATITREAFWLE